jgi:hypothetical protein
MMDGPITFELLNAYVDGELDKAAAAEVAKAVAEDKSLASQVASLTRLRSALAESVEAPDLSIDAPGPVNIDISEPMINRGGTIAASIAFLMFIAGSILVSSIDQSLVADMQQQAWKLHRTWSIDTPASPAVINADYVAAMPEAYVPDLTAARLTIVHTAMKPLFGNRRALLVGYRGTRGCKISLAVFPVPNNLGETLRPSPDGNMEGFIWRAASLGYVIMSDGMDSGRFRMLAESVHRTIRQHLPFDKNTRTALRESRDKSAPCLA